MKLFAELRDLVFDRLNGAITVPVTGGNVSVYDHVPASPVYPYIALEDHSWQGDDTDTSEGGNFTLTIAVYSKYKGSKEAAQIASAVRERLRHQESQFSPTGFSLLTVEVSEGSGLLESDAASRQARLSVLLKVDDINTQSY